jgi:hypothetical protein
VEDEKQSNAVSFVTKKTLVTFHPHITLMVDGNAIRTDAAICEHQESAEGRGSGMPLEFMVVALPNDNRLKKSLHIRVGYNTVNAMVDLD